MEIKIKKIETQRIDRSGGDPEVTDVYRVVDDGREFTITLTSHRHGSALGIVGQEGVLYTDRDSNTVRRQVITVGRSCGVTIDADELVEGLSVPAIKGVVFANRTEEMREITLIAQTLENWADRPVVFIDGRITDLSQYL